MHDPLSGQLNDFDYTELALINQGEAQSRPKIVVQSNEADTYKEIESMLESIMDPHGEP
jgi:hypothetical protein